MTFNPDIVLAVLQFLIAAIGIALTTQNFVPSNLVPLLTFASAVLSAAIGIFFVARKPVTAARASAQLKK